MEKQITGWVTEMLHFRISPFPTNCDMHPFIPNMIKFGEVHFKQILLSYLSKQIRARFAKPLIYLSWLWLHKIQLYPGSLPRQRKALALSTGLLKSKRRYCVHRHQESNWIRGNMFGTMVKKKPKAAHGLAHRLPKWHWKLVSHSNDLL